MVWIKTELDHLVSARYPEADGELIEWSNNGTANVTQEVADALVENRSYIDYFNDDHDNGDEDEDEDEDEGENDDSSRTGKSGAKPDASVEAKAAAVVAESESDSDAEDAADDE